MHVVHLETGRHLYGGAQQVLYLLEGLTRAGVSNILVCPPDSAISTAAGNAGVNVHPMPMAGDLDVGFGRRFSQWLIANKPGLLHVHSRRGADLWGGLAARRAGVPAVLSRRVDNPDFPLLGPIKYRMYARIIAISAEIERQLQRGGVPDSKLRLVHSAVDVEACQPDWSYSQFRDAFGLQKDEIAVVCVAQFITRKGHAVLLDAWPAVIDKCPQARLILFGQGVEESHLQDQVRHLNLSETVQFAGFRADILSFLGHADLLVHPALREGLGICLLEAQAAGLPIVASRAGGIPEAVADEVSGLLVPPQNPSELAAVVTKLLRDPDKRSGFGAGGRMQVAQNFSVQSLVSGNLKVYEELLS
jgi:glycosyltransferase involved in cell wall biosynthesis